MLMRDRPSTRILLRNSARIICLNEADAFLNPQDETCRELIRLFILTGYKGIVIRVELLARYISTRSQNWGTTFGMFRCFFGTEIDCIDPEYDAPTFNCVATTGPHMSKENLKHYVGERLLPSTYGD